MGEKDISEKALEDYNDVFSDIVNGIVFHGVNVIKEEDLHEIHPGTSFKAFDCRIHMTERDVLKCWKHGLINIALLGLENQSAIDDKMVLRVIGYDGSAYQSQLTDFDARMRAWTTAEKHRKTITEGEDAATCNPKPEFHPIPVLTLVLYFGNERWNRNLHLKDIMDVPLEMEPFFNDYKVNVVEVARLAKDEISRFKSDFRIVAEFVSRKRNDPDFGLNDTTSIIHVDEMMKLIAAITGDKRYTLINNAKFDEQYGGKIKNMCEIADRLEKIGIEKGFGQGIDKGDELRLIRQVIHNKSKGKNALQMTEYLDESFDKIEMIYNFITETGCVDAEAVYDRIHNR